MRYLRVRAHPAMAPLPCRPLRRKAYDRALDVEPRVLRVALDEPPARFHFITHERGEDLVGFDRVLDRDLQNGASLRIHGRFPELLGIHFAQTLVALDV